VDRLRSEPEVEDLGRGRVAGRDLLELGWQAKRFQFGGVVHSVVTGLVLEADGADLVAAGLRVARQQEVGPPGTVVDGAGDTTSHDPVAAWEDGKRPRPQGGTTWA
jgi:hypothetical protein